MLFRLKKLSIKPNFSKNLKLLALAALIGVIFWLPRGFKLDRFVATDEVIWVFRSANYYYALGQREFSKTFVNSSPGVITLWADTAGFLLEFPEYRGLGQGYLGNYFQFEEFLFSQNIHPKDILFASRSVMVLVHSIVTAVSFLFAWKLFGKYSVILGFLLIAFDPFFIGNSRLSHLDGPLTTFLFLSLLSLLVYLYKGRNLFPLIVSGLSGSLALLAKLSGLLLIPFVGMLLSLAYFRETRTAKQNAKDLYPGIWQLVLKPGLLWIGVYIGSLFVFWPVFWSVEGRIKAIRGLFWVPANLVFKTFTDTASGKFFEAILEVIRIGATQYSLLFLALVVLLLVFIPAFLMFGGLYLREKLSNLNKSKLITRALGAIVLVGGAVALYLVPAQTRQTLWRYPNAFLWRTTPLVLIGLLASFLAIRKSSGEYAQPGIRYAVLDLFSFTLVITIFLTIPSKWAEDYYLPVYPIFDLIAGIGWSSLIAALVRRWKMPAFKSVPALIGAAVIGFQVLLSMGTFPYYLSYYNPLLGGGSSANGKLFIGVGEGLDQVGRYLNAKPEAEELNVLSWYGIACLSYYFDGNVSPISHLKDYSRQTLKNSDYLVTYTNQWLRGHPQSMIGYLENVRPEHTIWIDGVEYARIYDVTTLPPEMFSPQE